MLDSLSFFNKTLRGYLWLLQFVSCEVIGVAVAQHFLYIRLGVGLAELHCGILLEGRGQRYIVDYREGAWVVGVAIAPRLEDVACVRRCGERYLGAVVVNACTRYIRYILPKDFLFDFTIDF